MKNAVVETFAGDTFTCTDYSNEDDYIYFDYNKARDEFKIGDTSFVFDDEMTQLLFDKFESSDVFPIESDEYQIANF